uniref:Uncharacterized protein n=1 Tax=Steinernema glaseri TaxID=37863 RepID=A0A1I8AFS5_9BILA
MKSASRVSPPFKTRSITTAKISARMRASERLGRRKTSKQHLSRRRGLWLEEPKEEEDPKKGRRFRTRPLDISGFADEKRNGIIASETDAEFIFRPMSAWG